MSLNGTSSDCVLLVFGVGSGIGSAVASLLVIKHFHKVALIARSEKNLQESKDTIEAAARSYNIDVEIRTWAADVTDLKTLKPILSEVEKFGELECVFYNAARVRPSPFFEETMEEIRYDFEITNIALYAVAQWAIPILQSLAVRAPSSSPSLLVTNSLLYKYPIPDFFTLSLTKAAQRILVETLAKTYKADGVHIGLISVGGYVNEEDPDLNSKNIADKTWEFFAQKKEDWTLDIEILPAQPVVT